MEEKAKLFTGRHFLIWMVTFFAVITVVNIIFITKAIESNSGVVTENPYEVGLRYNQILEAREKQKALGWKGVTAVREGGKALSYTLMDKSGHPVTGAEVSAQMLRPLQKGYDFTVSLTEGAPGQYSVPIHLPVKGAWKAHVSVVRGKDTYDDVTSLDIE